MQISLSPSPWNEKCILVSHEPLWLIKVVLNVNSLFPLPLSFHHCREPQNHSVPYHYYEPRGPDECAMYISHERGRRGSHHRFITEKRVFANWARTFDIHFYQPDWSPPPLPANRTLEGTVTAAPLKTWLLWGLRKCFRNLCKDCKDLHSGGAAPLKQRIKHEGKLVITDENRCSSSSVLFTVVNQFKLEQSSLKAL